MAEGITVYGAAGAGNPSLQTTRLAVSFAAAASGRRRTAMSQLLMASARGVLAVGFGQCQQLQVGAAVQALVDLQAGGALVAVNKNKGLVGHGADSWQGWEMGCGNLQRRSKI